VDSVTDDTLLKSINLNLLMHTRSDDVRLQVLALTCSENVWRSHGGKLLGPRFSFVLIFATKLAFQVSWLKRRLLSRNVVKMKTIW
jgi:hypothetical protein